MKIVETSLGYFFRIIYRNFRSRIFVHFKLGMKGLYLYFLKVSYWIRNASVFVTLYPVHMSVTLNIYTFIS